ncbi:MAG: signal peptidase [Planctomycetes bacterium]|nr:signal peptidase [Planctomycetota bacterium]
MTEADKSKHKHSSSGRQALVSYSKMGFLGWFSHNEKHLLKAETRIIIETDRGLEMGRIVGPFCYKAGTFRKDPAQVKDYFGISSTEFPFASGGKFVRYATADDLSEEKHINTGAEEELKRCRQLVKKMNLPMKLADIEHIFGGERIIFYFTAEDRVDFRELVRELAKEYQTRIEMRQVGSRDAARITADVESCGQPCCCARFLKILSPVNMRMAKLQKATLDPSKISGYCGRLKCCLRYEDQTYKELGRRLPKKRARVSTPQGPGVVVDAQILTQLIKVKGDDGAIFAVPLEEIRIIKPNQNDRTPAKDKNADNKPTKNQTGQKEQ